MTRFSSFINNFRLIQEITPSTLTRLSNKYNKDFPTKFTPSFTSTVVLTDGSTFTIQTSLPCHPRIDLVKDNLQHHLWNPRIDEAQLDKNSDEFIRFNKKFSESDLWAELSHDESGICPIEIKKAPKVQVQEVKKKKKK
jgi:hypothetical protein